MTRTRSLALLASLLLAPACARPAARPASPPPPAAPAMVAKAPLDADEAERFLLGAETFEDVKISYEGSFSRGVRAFRAVFASPDAAERFRRIVGQGTLAGRLYATIGLRHHDPAAYAEAVTQLRAREGAYVPAMFGCDGTPRRVGDLLENREATAIRLSPGQTLADWLALHHTGHLDIVGGAFTSEFGEVPSRL